MSEKQSFWKSIPDVLKYIAGILGGIAAVFLVLYQLGIFNDADKLPPKIVSFKAARPERGRQPLTFQYTVDAAHNR